MQLYQLESTNADSDALDMDVGATLVTRPRLLLCGPEEAGQSHLAPALIHALEGPPSPLDWPTIPSLRRQCKV